MSAADPNALLISNISQYDVDFVILDDRARIGDVWRRRWDSLRLFTPARHAGLDGLPFPAPPFSFPDPQSHNRTSISAERCGLVA